MLPANKKKNKLEIIIDIIALYILNNMISMWLCGYSKILLTSYRYFKYRACSNNFGIIPVYSKTLIKV